jgi:dimethylargininase
VKTVALTRKPSPLLERGERTHVGRDAIDFTKALQQHDAYRAALAELGANVTRLEDADAFPDGVFVEDTALVLDEAGIMMRPGAASRRGEVQGIGEVLERYRELFVIAPPATIDGGDIVVAGKRILVGQSARTNAAGIAALAHVAKRFGYETRGVRMTGCLHLKSGCTALPDGRLLINRGWIDERDLEGFEFVDVPEAEPWGGDVAFIGDTVLAAAAFAETLETLRAAGYPVRSVDVSEFAKAEGGVTCMSLIFTTGSRG